MQEEQKDLLTNVEHNLVRASIGKRLLNYIIDILAYFVLVEIIISILVFINPGLEETLDNTTMDFDFGQFLLNTSIYIGYMFLTEAMFKGKSLGKLVSGTRAININGTNITSATAMKRALIRAIPFSAFSALATPSIPWWDKWTNTIVVDEKLSANTLL